MKKLSNNVEYKNSTMAIFGDKDIIGDKLSFEASEAYKLLRTNLMFSFSDINECKVIGITSSIRGEGKSITSINLAYSLAETGKKVILLECDLRLPTFSKRLKLNASPGLSNVLVQLNSLKQAIQKYQNFHVITAGDITPNPSELLGSKSMKDLIESLAKSYNYVIVDLPPINVVSDASVISKLLDGMIIVVRHDYTDRKDLEDTIRQLSYSDTKILGFVFNGSSNFKRKYGKKYYGNYSYDYSEYGVKNRK